MKLHNRKTVINYAPEGTPPKSQRKKINIALYLYIIGLIIFSLYILNILYSKIKYIEFSGYIQVPKVIVMSYKDSIVDKIFIKNGLPVKKGEPLFSIKYSTETKSPISVKLNLQAHLDNLKVKLNSIEEKLNYINTPDILRINGQISSLKAEIVSKKSYLKALQKILLEKKELERTSKPLELSTINPDIFENMKFRIENIKATILSLESTLKSLEEERDRLEKIVRNGLLFKKKTVQKSISLLENELKKVSSPVFQADINDIIKSKVNGRVLQVNVSPKQSIAKGDSLAVILPDRVKIKFLLFSGQKKLIYLHKGVPITLLLSDGRELEGKLVDIYSAALRYQPKLTKKYWPTPSPLVGEIEVKNPPKNLVVLDGLKIKAVIERKIWNIF
ncbi:HlyD family secretion protein [Nitratifractor sp.]